MRDWLNPLLKRAAPAATAAALVLGMTDGAMAQWHHGGHFGFHHDWHAGPHFGFHRGVHWDPAFGWYFGGHFGPHAGLHHDWHFGRHHGWNGWGW